MPNYRRIYQPNACVFITVVTAQRTPYFHHKENILLYQETLQNVQNLYPFDLIAYVILPDHFHWLLNLTGNNKDFSKIVHSFKRNFTVNYKHFNDIQQPLSIWQKRYWDHMIRNEKDLQKHLDYIHWNPVKHKIASQPDQYEFSSFNKFIENGFYPSGWESDYKPQFIESMDLE